MHTRFNESFVIKSNVFATGSETEVISVSEFWVSLGFFALLVLIVYLVISFFSKNGYL